jgi:hypothetical protein
MHLLVVWPLCSLTQSIEFDFLILEWEMDKNRTSLMHLSLEGIFQAKQRSMLQALIA